MKRACILFAFACLLAGCSRSQALSVDALAADPAQLRGTEFFHLQTHFMIRPRLMALAQDFRDPTFKEEIARMVGYEQLPTTPPNALTGSHPCAATYAASTSSATATPHGPACFTTTAAGSSNRCTSRHAASASSRFR